MEKFQTPVGSLARPTFSLFFFYWLTWHAYRKLKYVHISSIYT